MRVLVTRPLEDSCDTADKLAALGHAAIIAPLLEIRFRAGGEISLDGVQAILITSANGLRALAQRTVRRDVPLFAVGRQSAQEARDAGFSDVRNAEGGSAALATAAAGWADPAAGALLHVSGAETAGDLAGALEATGFTVRRETLYEAVQVTELPDAACTALSANTIDAVLIFSARSAEAFVQCIRKAALEEACASLTAIAISEAAAKPLRALTFKSLRIPTHPNQDAMLARLSA
jgi:uroporphyrinogen-III synthase